MRKKRTEAVPTFPTWRRRLEKKERELQQEIEQFLQILRVLGTPMVEGSSAHFVYYNPQAREVKLAGDLGTWGWVGTPMNSLGHTGVYYCTVQLDGQKRVEYKFVVDGQWVVDPFCPNSVDNGVGGQNSYFVLGDFREPPELEWVPSILHGRVEEFSFPSTILGNRRGIHVYLPPGYEDPHKSFPTFYVHDGGEYLTRARFAVVADNLLHCQAIPPLILVLVDPVNREQEYNANEDYARFLEQELLPHIEGRYRTLANREARGVMGASMGGLISAYVALSRPHLFSRVGGQSSAFFLEEEKILALARALEMKITFYFDVGKYEAPFIPAHHRLLPLLQAPGSPCFFQEVAGGHDWTTWRSHLKDLLCFLWSGKIPSTEVL